jgi:hypothetical protein
LCETFLNEHNAKLCNIDGYSLVSNDRNTHGRGVAIYVSDSLNYTLCDPLTYNIANDFESIFIECSPQGRSNKLLVGEIYRTPNSNLHLTHERYNELLHKLPHNQQVIIGTDQNIDFFKLHLNSHTDFLQMFISQGFIPCMNEATRVTASTATLIDNIYIKGLAPTDSHIITAHYSDHYPIMVTLPSYTESKNKSVTFESRKFNPDTYANIETDLLAYDWSLLHILDSNNAFAHFADILSQIIDKHAPLCAFTISQRNLRREPWFTKALQTSSKKLHKLHKHSISTKTPQAHTRYTQYRNMYNKIRKAAKNMNFSQLFNEYRNDIKKTWHLILDLTGNKRTTKNPIQSLDINGTLIANPQDIVEAFANHFASVSTKSSTHPFRPQDHRHITPSNASFFLTPTTVDEILTIIHSLKSKKSSGHDSINTQLLKKLKNGIALPLEIIANKSFSEGTFPTSLKKAKVIPIHKSKEKTLTVSYRPIALLPPLSKIFEKLLAKRLTQFFHTHSTLTDNQFGFRKKHSTLHAVTKFALDIITNIIEDNTTLATFIDFSKAFDKINHQILLHKLSLYGIRGIALSFISSYLENRPFFVSHNHCTSTLRTIQDIGVPQGSILGPLLFLLYINDLPTYLTDANTILFADDTTIYHTNNNIYELKSTMNNTLNKLHTWCQINKIDLNLAKTKYMIFHNKVSHNPNASFPIHINNTPIERVTFFKFLGITIDEKLKWSEHTKSVKIKLAQGLHALCTIQNKSSKK